MTLSKSRKIAISIAVSIGVGASLLAIKSSNGAIDRPVEQNKALFIKAHQIQSEELFLTDKVSDFRKYSDGYVIGERFKGSLLFLDANLTPIKRIGGQGDGPGEMRNLGPLQVINEDIAVVDRGHARIVLMNSEGEIKSEIRSDLLASRRYNIEASNDQVMFSVPDTRNPIVTLRWNSFAEPTYYAKTASNARNKFQARYGNEGFIQKIGEHYLYFPPMQTHIDLLDGDLTQVDNIDISTLDVFSPSLKRANDIYSTTSNKTLQYYIDVYPAGDKFYVLAYTDKQDPTNGKYKRSVNNVIEVTYDVSSSDIRFSKVIELKKDRTYSQILIEDNKLLAFNFKDFTIDEYKIED